MRFTITTVGIVALAVVLLLDTQKNADPAYRYDLPSAYGIVERVNSSTHESELQDAIRALEQSDFITAEKIYRSIIQQDPNDYLAYHGLGSSLTYQKKYDQAQQAFLSALKLAPDNASSHAGLGAIAAIKEDQDEAIRQYEKAISLNPRYGIAYWGLGVAYYAKKQCPNAVYYLAMVPELLPHSIYAEKSKEYVQHCKEQTRTIGDIPSSRSSRSMGSMGSE